MPDFIKTIIIGLLFLTFSGCAAPRVPTKDVETDLDTRLLGLDFKTFIARITHDEIQKVEDCCWGIKRQGELLVVLYDKKNLTDYQVRHFEIISPLITFNDELRVGMTIDDLLTLYPDIELRIDEDDYKTEYFLTPSLLTYKPNGSLDTVITFEAQSEKGKPLSSKQIYPTREFSRNGFISKIAVFKW